MGTLTVAQIFSVVKIYGTRVRDSRPTGSHDGRKAPLRVWSPIGYFARSIWPKTIRFDLKSPHLRQWLASCENQPEQQHQPEALSIA
jgi:hypothetical protein